tara:strand:- start:114 stop:479 length:366 start_codon:yes stop_codon:yes gene_type:complete
MLNNQYSPEFINYIKIKYKNLPLFLDHIQLLIYALNDYIDEIEECILNPAREINHKFHLDKLKQYHIMTCEMISVIKDEEREYIKLWIEDNFIDAHRYAMKNDLVMKNIKEYLNVYKDLCN